MVLLDSPVDYLPKHPQAEIQRISYYSDHDLQSSSLYLSPACLPTPDLSTLRALPGTYEIREVPS